VRTSGEGMVMGEAHNSRCASASGLLAVREGKARE